MADNDHNRSRASYPPTNPITSRTSIITNNKPKSLPLLRATVSTDPPPPNGADGRSFQFTHSTFPNPVVSTIATSTAKAPLKPSSLSLGGKASAKPGSHPSFPTPFALPHSTSRPYVAIPPYSSQHRLAKPPSTRERAPPPRSPSLSSKSEIKTHLAIPSSSLKPVEPAILGPLPETVRISNQEFSFKVGTKYLGTDRSAWLNLAKKACFDHGFELNIRNSSKDDSLRILLCCGSKRERTCPFQFQVQPKRLSTNEIEYTVTRFTNKHDHPKLSWFELVPPKLSSTTSAPTANDATSEQRRRRKPERYGHPEGAAELGRKRQDEVMGSRKSEVDHGNDSDTDGSSDLSSVERDQDEGDSGSEDEEEEDVADSARSKATMARDITTVSTRQRRIRFKPDFTSCENDINKIRELVREGTGYLPWAVGGRDPYFTYRCKFGTQNGMKTRKGPRCPWKLVRQESEGEKGEWIIDEDASGWYHNHPLSPLVSVPATRRKRTRSTVSVTSDEHEDEEIPPPAPLPDPRLREESNVIWLLDSDDEDVKPSPSAVDHPRMKRLQKQARIAPAQLAPNAPSSSQPRPTSSVSTTRPQNTASSSEVSLESFLLELGLGRSEGENDFMFPLILDNLETWHTLDYLAPSFRASKTFNTPTRIEKAQSRMFLQTLRTEFESLDIGQIEEGWWRLIGDAIGNGLAARR